ncbi:MAG: adenylate/guanylate cyclase domain-containing protein [candidate division Zixibacteria bacterium HGW-Zixibacteria-1]|nr:MAG: adenylate/guanylate cyclase domain-containing protein [candidate division Zixibacteria bacterium HGW-Zixibacteria-1]
MALSDDLKEEIKKIFCDVWSTRKGLVVPESNDIKLDNDAVILDGTVLYADINESTNLVDNYNSEFAAEIYRSFLHCTAKIIRAEGGTITSYDGDRIMAVYIGKSKNSDATRIALKINYAVKNIINPSIRRQYQKTSFLVKHVVGIDTSKLMVARTGIRGSNDLVWVGQSANYAAKLSSRPGPPTQITAKVYGRLNNSSKFGKDNVNMWQKTSASELGTMIIYTSKWSWKV